MRNKCAVQIIPVLVIISLLFFFQCCESAIKNKENKKYSMMSQQVYETF